MGVKKSQGTCPAECRLLHEIRFLDQKLMAKSMNESSLTASYPVQFIASALLPLKNRVSLVARFSLFSKLLFNSSDRRFTAFKMQCSLSCPQTRFIRF